MQSHSSEDSLIRNVAILKWLNVHIPLNQSLAVGLIVVFAVMILTQPLATACEVLSCYYRLRIIFIMPARI